MVDVLKQRDPPSIHVQPLLPKLLECFFSPSDVGTGLDTRDPRPSLTRRTVGSVSTYEWGVESAKNLQKGSTRFVRMSCSHRQHVRQQIR